MVGETLTNITKIQLPLEEDNELLETEIRIAKEVYEDRKYADAHASNIKRRSAQLGNTASVLDQSPPYVDLKPQKAKPCGKWHYMCTRNNNFSNRSQKGKIIVKCEP